MKTIRIRDAKEHNLKNINIDIPKNKLVIITGVSGSGKSSLAFDTIYAEGQRRYVESLSSYARQFLELMQKPDVESIEGLSPAISIEQKSVSKNPRSTVGTVTEIYDYLRLLFAKIGVPHSPVTGLPIESQTITKMVDRIMQIPYLTKVYIIAPVVTGKKGEYKRELQALQKQGFQRIFIDGELFTIDTIPNIDKNKKHTIEVVVDRLVIGDSIRGNLPDSLETALKLSDGIVYVQEIDTAKRTLFSSRFSCPVSGFSIDQIEPRLFSFNSPFGACSTCGGLGLRVIFDIDTVVPDKNKSVKEGAVAPWAGGFGFYYLQILEAVLGYYNVSPNIPFSQIPHTVQNVILYGSGEKNIPMQITDQTGVYRYNKPFDGVIPFLERKYRESDNERRKKELEKYQRSLPCEMCGGYRLNEKALCVKINKLHIGQVTDMTISDALKWFTCLSEMLNPQQQEIAKRVLKEIQDRLRFLTNVGLEYMTLSRPSETLSGGESQRIRLASQVGSRLTGVMYVLDEPSIGLHQRDNDKLLNTIQSLRDLGNSVLVVEHDENFMRSADHIIDMGLGAGIHGGEVIAQGSIGRIMNHQASITGAYLAGRKKIPIPDKRRAVNQQNAIKVVNAKEHNLQNITVNFPLGVFTCVTGVSGSGKSTLVTSILYRKLAEHFWGSTEVPGACDSVEGLDLIDKVIDINQAPIGRTPHSNPATYIGVFDHIRNWFASLPESKARGYTSGRFSFNVKGGRCEACRGDGVIKIEMHFLPAVYVQCEQCLGTRYNKQTLEVKYKNKSIADILNMTVDEALELFTNIPAIHHKLQVLSHVGLGYIHVGQQATTLSGGEAQRVKLAKELSKRATGRTLYIMDEPTTGLSFADIHKLLEIIHAIVDQGNTVIVIEHNMDVIKTADWIIDLGPEGGANGGNVVIVGTPETVVETQIGYTSYYLKKALT